MTAAHVLQRHRTAELLCCFEANSYAPVSGVSTGSVRSSCSTYGVRPTAAGSSAPPGPSSPSSSRASGVCSRGPSARKIWSVCNLVLWQFSL